MDINNIEIKELLDIYKILLDYLDYLETEEKKVVDYFERTITKSYKWL